VTTGPGCLAEQGPAHFTLRPMVNFFHNQSQIGDCGTNFGAL